MLQKYAIATEANAVSVTTLRVSLFHYESKM